MRPAVADIASIRMRSAGREALSLALIDARNHSLRWLAGCEQALAPRLAVAPQVEFDPPLWTFGRLGWFQERWIARNLQRGRGAACDPAQPRLASILPGADRCYDAASVPHAARWQIELPDAQAVRGYLVETLETTLDLLAGCADEDDALFFYRAALAHEDESAEALAVLAQTAGFDPRIVAPAEAAAARDALLFPATVHEFGSPPGGFVPDLERWAHPVAVPEFEIDAQAVRWSQYAEFVEDGGYDDARWWSAEGWAWVERLERRCPRHVEQMRHGVLAHRFGALSRVALALPATHLSWHEADAWCRWAGRRLPTEVEWEHAVLAGASRGLRWGEVLEWTASTLRPFEGFRADPWRQRSPRPAEGLRAVRGASFATRPRQRQPRRRQGLAPASDHVFVGFRSCAA